MRTDVLRAATSAARRRQSVVLNGHRIALTAIQFRYVERKVQY